MAKRAKIGLFGRTRDKHISMLRAALSDRGAEALVVDFQGFPRFNRASMGAAQCWNFDAISQRLPIDLLELDLAVIRSFSYSEASPDKARSWSSNDVARRSRQQIIKVAFQTSLLEALLSSRKIPAINPPRSFLFHRQKGRQHHQLLRHGLLTPRALVTNDIERAKAFVARFRGRVVVKPQSSGAEVILADEEFFEANAVRLMSRPFMFQQMVSGRSYRVYLLGGELECAGEIIHDRTRIDWRERIEKVEPYNPPPEVSNQLRRAVKLLNLPYCGVDLEYDDTTDRVYLLDFNPAAYFIATERLFGVDLAGRIADYLLKVVKRGGQVWPSAGGSPSS